MTSLWRIYSSNSRRFTSFRVPTKSTNGQFGCFSMASILFIPMLLYSAASFIVSVILRWIGTCASGCTHRRYGSFAVKITCEVSFFVAHSGVSSCSANTRKMVISVCNLPNGRERAGTTGVSPQLTICQSRPHRLRRFYHARTVTGREYHYALCGS